MVRLVTLLCLCALFILASMATSAAPPELFISPDGDDTWSGKLAEPNAAGTDGPLATLEAARDALRRIPTDERAGATVSIRDGVYRLAEPFTLGPQDCGTEGNPVTWRAYPGEKPRLTGTRVITGFEPWQGNILQADLRTQGFGDIHFRQLFVAGQRQVLARYPNFDPQDPHAGVWTYTEAAVEPGSRTKFRAAAADIKGWQDVSQAELFFYHRYNYYNTIVPIASIDPETRVVTAAENTYDDIAGDGAERYYFQNVLEALDTPGEWYLDYRTMTLYLWPPEPLDDATVEAPILETIVQFQPGASDIVLRGLTVEMSDGAAIDLRDTVRCLIAGNTVRATGVSREIGGWDPWEDRCGIGIFGGHDNGAVGNDVSDTGSHGIKLTGGEQRTLTPARNYAENNVIHHTGVFWAQGCGARLEGVGNRFSRNLVYDCPRMGVIFGGHDHIVEYNRIRHTNLQTCDTGAIYTGGRSWLAPRGCVIRYNYIDDIGGYGREAGKWTSPVFSWGIYLDDLACGVDVIGNIVVGARRGNVHLHNARDCVIENNILIDGIDQQIECNGWADGGALQPVFEKNWDEFKLLPAWAKYRYFTETDPRTATQMAHNAFVRNIIAYSDDKARLLKWGRLPLDQTQFDYNTVYHYGKPLSTGVTSSEPLPGTPDIALNGDFERGKLGEMPEDWVWQVRPTEEARATLTDESPHSGTMCLRIDATETKDEKGNPRFAMVRTRDIPIKPGKAYYLTAWMRTDKPGSPGNLVVEAYKANAHYWASDSPLELTGEWKQYSNGFTVPGPDDPGYQPTLQELYIRLDFRVPEGALWIDGVELREAKPINEWQAWQEKGLDVHSVVADPQFIDPAHGDYRLKPTSPALELGFEPIAVDKIGPYEDEYRASWPVKK